MGFLAAPAAKKFRLAGFFNAFGDQFEFQRLPHPGDRLGDRHVIWIRENIPHEGLIDFEFVDWQPFQVAQDGYSEKHMAAIALSRMIG